MKDAKQARTPDKIVKPVHTDFRRFRDGAILDLIRNPKVGTGLILYRHGEIRTGAQLQYKGRLWLPSRYPIIARMRLPQRVANAPVDGIDDILSAIIEFLLTYIDFSSDTDARAAAHYALSTWFTHRIPMAPILSIVGPTGSGKTKLARCLNCICRRPLLFSDLNAANLRSLPLRLRPTLIMDEIKMNDEMVRLLRAGPLRGRFSVLPPVPAEQGTTPFLSPDHVDTRRSLAQRFRAVFPPRRHVVLGLV